MLIAPMRSLVSFLIVLFIIWVPNQTDSSVKIT
jgi:hypothetical protein